MTTILVILSILSTCLSIVPVMYQVTISEWGSYLSNLYNYTPLVQEPHFSDHLQFQTSHHYPRLAGVYTRLEGEEMDTPVYQKVELVTGRAGVAYLFRREVNVVI
jgi:hypothetical protein